MRLLTAEKSISPCRIGMLGVVAMLLPLMIGCSSPTTRVAFDGPPGSVLFVDKKPYHLPASIELDRPKEAGKSKRYDASLVTTVRSQELRANGYLELFGYSESDVDKMAVNTSNLDEAQLARILDGNTVVFRGQSASRQHLYDLTLRK